MFSTTEREDGTLQLVAGKYPLYTYGGDAAPGDTTGQGSGDVWFAVNLDGTLVSDDAPTSTEAPDAAAPEGTEAPEAPSDDPYAQPAGDEEADDAPAPAPAAEEAPVTIASTDLGDVMVDADGLTLYGFTLDTNGTPTCLDKCADAWPPLLVDGPDLPAGLDPNIFTVVERPDGSHQLKAGKWPLYNFAGDAEAGDVNGQGSGGVWFVLDPAAKLIK